MEGEKTDISNLGNARAWLDMAQAKWRLQTMQHRSRYNPKTGEYRQLPTRIRRFLNGTPVGMKTAVLALLKESAPYRSPVFDCEIDEGLVYNPTNTFIRKDGIEHATGGKDPTYTIIQDLLLADGGRDAFMFGDESTCAQVGETEYRWDEPDVEDCPDGGQGVSYQVTDVSRDRETDLFSYRIRKVQALTVHVAPHVEECGKRRRVEVETWDNVYGEPGAYRQDPVKGGSAPISLPAPCSQPKGRSVKIDVYRNPDCTYRLTVQTAYAVADDEAQYSIYKDQYKVSASAKSFNQQSGLPKTGIEYSDGVMTRYSSERNEDGTWNNSTEKETERPVSESTVETRIGPRGTHRLRTDTNQRLPARGISSMFGSWKATKTPGGLYTNEYSEYVRNDVGDLGLSCGATVFMHTHETQASAAAVPSTASTHVPAAADGLVTTWTYDTDSEGSVTRRERKEQEIRVDNAARHLARGYLGDTSGRTHRSVPKSVADGLISGAGIGTTVDAKITNGGLWDVEERTFLPAAGRELGLDCSKTLFQHSHETSRSADSIGAEAADAGGGRTYRKSYSVDPSTGAITCREQVTRELPVSPSRVSIRVTSRGTETRTTSANAPSVPATPTAPGSVLEWERTPGGLYNVTTGSFAASGQETGRGCERDVFVHTDSTTSTASSKSAEHATGGSGGQYGSVSSRLGDDGLWETTVTRSQETEADNGVEVTVTARGTRRTEKTRNAARPAEPGAGEVGRSVRSTRTRGGLYDVEETTFSANPGTIGTDCSRDLFSHSDTETSTSGDKKPAHVPATEDGSGKYGALRQQLGDDGLWTVSETDVQEISVSSQRLEERVTKYGRVRRITDMQVASEGNELSATLADVGKERAYEKTRGGRRNLTTVTVTPVTGQTDESCEKTAFLHTHMSAETLGSKALSHVDNAAAGKYLEERWSLTDVGTWEKRVTEHQEEQPELTVRQYEDAFGTTTVEESFSHASEDGDEGAEYDAETLVRSVEATLTNGKRYNVRTTTETPEEVDSGWLHWERETEARLAVYDDFIVFRNATLDQVKGWLEMVRTSFEYVGPGSFAVHPRCNISPNKFGLWDGTIGLTTTFTPKHWASGGTTKEDDWDKTIKIKSVSFIPLSSAKLLKVVTTETHRRGGGVGEAKLQSLIGGGVIKGSQFSYHPGGQAYSYDLITESSSKGIVMDMPGSQQAKDLWDGQSL